MKKYIPLCTITKINNSQYFVEYLDGSSAIFMLGAKYSKVIEIAFARLSAGFYKPVQ